MGIEIPAGEMIIIGDGGSLARVLLGVTLILFLAKLAGDLAIRVRLPSVLGELLIGVMLGNLLLVGFDGLLFLRSDPVLDGMGKLGAIILLFTIGLKSDIRELARVGLSSAAVAVLGVVAPIVLGFFVSRYFHPDGSTLVHLFVGAALCATSVGITARVLEDAGRIGSPEGRIILGAAVIDDLLALVVLALVTGMVAAADAGEVVASTDLIPVLIKVGLFFALATVSALFLSKRLFSVASHLRGRDLLLVTALVFCLGLAWAAEELGLAPIVGAFFAGLALDETTYQEFFDHGETRRLEDLVEPIEAFLVPVFFVLMGLRVDLGVLASPEILGFALALTGVAIFGKQICGLGVRERDTSRLAVGIGMIPRGEVGLVFAGVGASLSVAGRPIIDPAVYSALVLMVFVTTLLTPSLMVAALSRHHRTAPSRG